MEENYQPLSLETLLSHGIWKPPEAKQWKLNVVATWFEESEVGGVGWIIRDSDGSLIEGLNQIAEKTFYSLERFDHYLVVESDAVELVRLINRGTVDLSEISTFIDEILALVPAAKVVKFDFNPRSINFLAHSHRCCQIWRFHVILF